MGYICTRCGGTNVTCEAIVNPNTGKIIDYFDGSFMHAICAGCVGNAPGRRVSARSGGGRHRSPVESKSVRKRFANRWMS